MVEAIDVRVFDQGARLLVSLDADAVLAVTGELEVGEPFTPKDNPGFTIYSAKIAVKGTSVKLPLDAASHALFKPSHGEDVVILGTVKPAKDGGLAIKKLLGLYRLADLPTATTPARTAPPARGAA